MTVTVMREPEDWTEFVRWFKAQRRHTCAVHWDNGKPWYDGLGQGPCHKQYAAWRHI